MALFPACRSTDDPQVTVAAAASLAAAFGRIETDFESEHPGVDVVLDLAGSGALREQILAGAPLDVFASANMANMQVVVEAGAVLGQAETFASNRLVIAVPAGNPAGVTGLDDLARDDLLVGLCATSAPCGQLARQMLHLAGVEAAVDTEEPDVRALVTKVAAGELDVAIAYASDVVASEGSVEGIETGGDLAAEYHIAVLSDAADPVAAEALVEHVLSPAGQEIMRDLGFEAP